MKCSYHAVIFLFGITLECPCLYKIDPCTIFMINNFTTQFTELMYRFKDLLPNCIIYNNEIK